MGKDAFIYVPGCILTYLALCAVELFAGKIILDMLNMTYWMEFIACVLFVLVINPVLCSLIMKSFNFSFKKDKGDN